VTEKERPQGDKKGVVLRSVCPEGSLKGPFAEAQGFGLGRQERKEPSLCAKLVGEKDFSNNLSKDLDRPQG